MPFLTQVQHVAIKQEGTAGTAATLALADVVLHSGPAEFEMDFMVTPREALSAALSPRGSVTGSQMAKIRWKQYLRGSYNHTTGASAAPAAGTQADWHIPFLGCGAVSTISGAGPNEQNSYKPSTAQKVDETTGVYCTVAGYVGPPQTGGTTIKKYMIVGAVGNCKLTFAVGVPVLAEFEFTGVFAPTTEVTPLVPIYPAIIEPPFLGASFLFGGAQALKFSSMTFDMGNEIVMRPHPNGTRGYFTAQIVKTRPTISMDPEEESISIIDFQTEWITGPALIGSHSIATGVFPSTAAGGTNYNQFSFTAPAAKLTKVGTADREGIWGAPLEFECRAFTDAGNDEWELIQT